MEVDSAGADWPALAARSLPWTGRPRPPESPPFVLATRILSYRNLAGHPFPVSASPEACLRLAETAAAMLARQGLARSFRFSDPSPPALRLLRERHLLPEPPVPLPGRKSAKRLVLGAAGADGAGAGLDEGAFAWINEVEHVTWVRTVPGLLPQEDFPAVHRPPTEEPGLPFARSPRLGLLASDPSRAGNGTLFRVLVHLPALGLARKLPQAAAALMALGIGCLPVTRRQDIPFGPRPPVSEGDLFWLVSRGSLGVSAEDAFRRFSSDVRPLLRWEAEAQSRCREKHGKRLEDRVQGSLQACLEAEALAEADWEKAASLARLGAYAGILDAQIPDILEDLRAKAGTGHLEVSSCRTLSKEEADRARSNVVRLSLGRYRARA